MMIFFTNIHEKYLNDALHGFISQQTNFLFFIAVVIDDFSSGGTAEVRRDDERKNPKIIKEVYPKENYSSQHKSK